MERQAADMGGGTEEEGSGMDGQECEREGESSESPSRGVMGVTAAGETQRVGRRGEERNRRAVSALQRL